LWLGVLALFVYVGVEVVAGAIIPPLYGALVDGKKEQLIVNGVNEASAISEAASFGY
jgi:fucose permease